MKPRAQPNHSHFEQPPDGLLRAHGLRRTPQRLATLDAIASASGHATAEEIVDAVRADLPAISASTVYRTLASLEEQGIVCHAHLGHSASVYHVGGPSPHQHLVCERCGTLEEADEALVAPFVRAITLRYGFRANFTHFAVLGECRSCASRSSDRP